MLRALVLALVLANLVYLVWVQGLLAPYGFAPASQAEPERLEQQIRPEAVELLTTPPAQPAAAAPLNTPAPGASAPASAPASSALTPATAAAPASAPAALPALPASAASAPAASAASRPIDSAAAKPPASATAKPVATAASKPTKPEPATAAAALVSVAADKSESEASAQCLQAGLFTEAQVSAMRPRLQTSLPAGSWTFVSGSTKPARWIVYMGKYVNKEALNKKRKLLEQANVDFETPASPQLNPGLSLGSYKTKAQAEAALAKLTERGIRSAKVVPERPELPTQWLRLPAPSASLQTKAKTLIPQISGKPLKACG